MAPPSPLPPRAAPTLPAARSEIFSGEQRRGGAGAEGPWEIRHHPDQAASVSAGGPPVTPGGDRELIGGARAMLLFYSDKD